MVQHRSLINSLQEQKRQQLRDEVLKRKEELKSENRIRRDTLRRSLSESSPTHQHNTSSSENSDPNAYAMKTTSECMEHRRSDVLIFTTVGRKFTKGSCLGHSIKGCTTFSGIDTDSGQLVYITEWNFKYSLLEQRNIAVEDFVNCK